MMFGENQQELSAKDKIADVFIRLSHPISYPFLAICILFIPFWDQDLIFFPFIGPLVLIGIARGFYKRWRMKPPIKLSQQSHQLAYIRALQPAALIAAVLVYAIFTSFLRNSIFSAPLFEIVFFPALIAFITRLVWNISLHHISLGALTLLTAYSSFAETLFWIPMLILTFALYLGWAMVHLKLHNLLQVAAGFLGGGLSIVLLNEVYIPLIRSNIFYFF